MIIIGILAIIFGFLFLLGGMFGGFGGPGHRMFGRGFWGWGRPRPPHFGGFWGWGRGPHRPGGPHHGGPHGHGGPHHRGHRGPGGRGHR